MKPFLFLLCFPFMVQAQKIDHRPLICEFFAGYAASWREVVLYHPNQLFARFPKLNREFWDIRRQHEPGFLNMEWDADHSLKAFVVLNHATAVAIKIGNGKPKFKTVLRDLVVNLLSYKAGWVVGWCFVHGNKL